MNILEDPNFNADEIMTNGFFDYYYYRMNRERKNIERVKKFYNDDKSFTDLMYKLIFKDSARFDKLMAGEKNLPNPWRIFYIILDIVQSDGEEVPPFDTLTNMFPSRNIIYHGWMFSWVHGQNTIISIFDPDDYLVYRF